MPSQAAYNFMDTFNEPRKSRKERDALVRATFKSFGDASALLPEFRCERASNISIGERTFVSFSCYFGDFGEVVIGNGCYIGPEVKILTKDRSTGDVSGVHIGDRCYVGAGAILSPGVNIAAQTYILPGTVVFESVTTPGTCIGGNPAKETTLPQVCTETIPESDKSEKEKQDSGDWYNVLDEVLVERCHDTYELLNEFTNTKPSKRTEFTQKMFGAYRPDAFAIPPVSAEVFPKWVHEKGDLCINYFSSFNGAGTVTFGDFVLVAPDSKFVTALGHASNPLLQRSLPITLKDEVWVGGSCVLFPGVTIGAGSVVGTGSVITQDIPPHSIAYGNPCNTIKQILPEYKTKYPYYSNPEYKSFSEKERMLRGMSYNAMIPELIEDRSKCYEIIQKILALKRDEAQERTSLYKHLFGSFGENTTIELPFFADYGAFVHIGSNTTIGHKMVLLDVCSIAIGDNVTVGNSVKFYGATHPVDPKERHFGEHGGPIKVENNAILCDGCTIIPNVTIGEGAVVLPGAVVTRDVAPHTVVRGSPARTF